MKKLMVICLLFGSTAQAQDMDTTLSVYFRINESNLDSVQVGTLASHLSTAMHVKQIIGYADSTGPAAYNLELSRKRAQNVAYILSRRFGHPFTYSVEYKGEEPNAKQLWQSRRVDVLAVRQANLERSGSNSVPETLPGIVPQPTKQQTLESVNLDNIYFLPDKAIIAPESLPWIEKLARELKTYSNCNFEIIGHVNFQSRKDASELSDMYALSEQRAKTIYALLIDAGIPAFKLKYRGVGNSQPIDKEPENYKQKRKNMRVQILIEALQ